MSEANNAWSVDVDGQSHQVEVEHSTMTGKIVVSVDGVETGEDRLLTSKRTVEFDLGGHPAEVRVHFTHGGFGAESELHVGGRYVEPLRR